MIKFPSSQDAKDIGAIEYAYSLMAKAADIVMPATHLFRTKRSRYFGAKRFDRDGSRRIHMHSLSGLIHTDHRTPSLDYDLILGVRMRLTRDVEEVEKVFRLACFNVLAHNRDDNAKNFSFLLNPRNEWVFAPVYDLVFSYGPGGEQSTLVMGAGKNPGVEHLLRLGKQHRIKNAPNIVDTVPAAVKGWKSLAEDAGVSAKSRNEIAARLVSDALGYWALSRLFGHFSTLASTLRSGAFGAFD